MYLLDMDVTVSPLFSFLLKTDLLIIILIDIYCRSLLKLNEPVVFPFHRHFKIVAYKKRETGVTLVRCIGIDRPTPNRCVTSWTHV